MYTINYRPALHHPIYKGGYYFVVFWALLDITMSLRHYFLYEGFTPAIFHLFLLFAIVLPLFKRTLRVGLYPLKTTYTSNIYKEPCQVDFENPVFSIEDDRQISSLVVSTSTQHFNTKMIWHKNNIPLDMRARLDIPPELS
jgi:hypothetical protein